MVAWRGESRAVETQLQVTESSIWGKEAAPPTPFAFVN